MSAAVDAPGVPPPSKTQVLTEIVGIAAFAAVFLVVFQSRPRYVDAVLGLAAVLLISLASGRSARIWARQPPSPLPPQERFRAAARWCLLFTVPAVVLFLAAGLALGQAAGGPPGALARVANWHLVPALLLYFPWALLQQFVFQFYLLGRLLYVAPPAVAIVATAVVFSLVHFPRLPVMTVTAVAGAVWALSYRRHRALVPLAASHATLGATLHYWVFGRDLFDLWVPGS